MIFYMKPKYAKTLINQLLTKHKSKENVALLLGITPRYIYMLQKKERKASPALLKLMKFLLDNPVYIESE